MTDTKRSKIKSTAELLKAGYSPKEIIDLKKSEWGDTERNVRRYIKWAREEIKTEIKTDPDLLRAYSEWKESDEPLAVWGDVDWSNPSVYDIPEDEGREWSDFVRYGWSREQRIKETYSDKTGLEKFDNYCEGVRDGSIDVCGWIKKAVDRHYKDLERQQDEDFPYYFEPLACLHYIKFFEHVLSHHTGVMSGEPIIFEPWQWFAFGSVFGWLKKERFHGYPLRRFRTAYVFVPKKNGKSLISGGTGLYMMDFDGWPGAQCFIIATSQTHAMELGYRDATIMIDRNEDLEERYNQKRGGAMVGIYCAENNSYFKPITSKADSEDGKNVHFCSSDETKDITDFAIYDLMEEGMISAPNGLMMNTTTAGFSVDSLGYDQQKYLEAVLNGEVIDDSAFGVIYGIDESDKEIDGWWNDLSLYDKANPNYGISVFEDALKAKFTKAKSSLAKRSSLITKHLNEWTSSNEGFIAEEKWASCKTEDMPGFMNYFEAVLEDYKGKPCRAGLDLGAVSDFTSLELVFGGDVKDVLSFFWIPEETIEERKNSSIVRSFVDQGYVLATDGDWTDHDFVEDCIKKVAETVDLIEVVYDRYKMNQMVTHLQEEGIEVTPFGQGYVSMSPAVDHFEDQVLKNKINHFGNPVLSWMNDNVSIKKDPAGNRKFDKAKSQDKIDGMVALSMALYRSSVDDLESDVHDGELITV